jgi:excisionase family DNA binding protein
MSTDICSWERADRAAFSPAETAKLLGISQATIFRLLKRGVLPSVMIGGSRRIPSVAIQRALTADSTEIAARHEKPAAL